MRDSVLPTPVLSLAAQWAAASTEQVAVAGGADALLSVRQVAARLGVCAATVYALADRGELPHVRILNAIRVAPDDLAEFIHQHRRT